MKLLGPKAGYIEILDHGTNELLSKQENKYMPLRPSSAGKCTRELGFEYMEFLGKAEYEKENKEPAVHRLLSLGHFIERHLIYQFQDAFEAAPGDFKIRYKQQVLSFFQLPNGQYIEGSIDSVFISEKYKALIDYKSKKDKWSSYFKTNWDETADKLRRNQYVEEFGEECFWVEDLVGFLDTLNDPFWEMNFYQLNLYFFDEGEFLRQRGVDHAALIYYNKNDSRVREIRFKPSKTVYERVEEKFLAVYDAVENQSDPMSLPRDFKLGSVKCAFCPFSKLCYGSDSNALKDYFKTFPPKRWPKDTDRMKQGSALEELFEEYKQAKDMAEQQAIIEEKIIEILDKAKVKKVRFKNGEIYELRTLKTGGVKNGPRLVLRRSKL